MDESNLDQIKLKNSELGDMNDIYKHKVQRYIWVLTKMKTEEIRKEKKTK